MEPFTTITGVAAPLLRSANVDTDLIIRIERLAQCPARRARPLGAWRPCASARRQREPGLRAQPARLREARRSCVAGTNFGCGSSREHAVWALQGMGIHCVIARLVRRHLPQQLLPERRAAGATGRCTRHSGCSKRWNSESARESRSVLDVDLQAQVVRWPGGRELPFAIEPRRREALLHGALDAIGLTRRLLPQIEAWQAEDRAARPWIWQGGGS